MLSLWSILLLAWLILHWGILPHIDDWRGQIEQRASQALGVPVRVARIEVRSSGWMPALSLHDVVLSDPQGREALRLPLVSAAVSAQSLFTWSLRFSQLYIEGAQLEVRRDAQGKLHVGGMDMGGASLAQDRQGADWFFRQHEFVIRGGSLRWVDEQRAAPPLALTGVDLVVRNSLRHHDLRLDATPPAGWGQRFSLRGRFSQPLIAAPSDWARWSGTVYAELPHADVAQLQQHVSLPFELRAGEGGLRLWLDTRRGQWRQATLDVALDAVQLRLASQLQPLGLARLSGRFRAEQKADGGSLSAQNLKFSTDEGGDWPVSQLALRWRQAPAAPAAPGQAEAWLPQGAAITGGEFTADRLDLALMAGIAERLPLPEPVLRGLRELAPEGHVQDLQAGWSGPLDQPSHYQAKARLSGISVAAKPDEDPLLLGRPGVNHLNMDLQANETGGEGRLVVQDGSLTVPGVFQQAEVPIQRLDGKLIWRIAPRPNAAPQVEVQFKEARLVNADLQAEFQGRWRTGEGAAGEPGVGRRFPGQLELSGRGSGLAAAQLARYLPQALGADTLAYLGRALVAGRVNQASFKLRGDLWAFPFGTPANPLEGDFRLQAKVEGVELDYAPPAEGSGGWPALSQLAGEVLLERSRLQFKNAQGKLWGLELKGINGQIADLLHQPVLAIEGQVRGPLADGLRFVAASPVAEMTQGALSQAVANGAAELKLGLSVPLLHPSQTQVKGALSLLGNDLRLRPDLPALAQAKARVDFTGQGFSVNGGTARVVGGEASFEGSMQPDGSLRFQGQGMASAEGLRATPELGVVARLAKHLSGAAPYRLQLALRHGQSELQVSSPLIGMASELPEPLRKPAEQPLGLRYQTRLLAPEPGSGERASRDIMRLELGSQPGTQMLAEYQRELSGSAEPRVLRGAVALGEPLPSPPPGMVQAALKLGRVNADAWLAVADGLAGAEPSAKAGASSPYLPTDVQLLSSDLTLHNRHLNQLSAQLQRRATPEGELWRAKLSAEQVQGQIDYLPASAQPGSGRLHARLARLALPQSDTEAVDSLMDQAGDRVPALDIVVDDFELRGKKLGKLEVEASYRGSEGRDWRLSKLNLSSADAKLVGSGRWSPGANRHMALDFQLDVKDGGGLLERLGMGRVVRGTSGHVQGNLAWNGSPLSPDWLQMTGQMQLALDGGQFLKVQPGAARLLGVLSLQSLPRRFLLDFRDLFQEGYAFDNVSGDVRLADGIARTSNLRIRSVQAVVLMQGQANLREETQDLRAYVVPEINAGTASLAYAAINPVIGLGTFLAQLMLRDPLREAGAREFHINGSWADPVVTDLTRASSASGTDLDSSAARQP